MSDVKPDWDAAPEWANYWAVDSCGEAYWYDIEPAAQYGDWIPKSLSYEFDTLLGNDVIGSTDFNWTEALYKRPNKLFLDLKASLEEAVEIEKVSKSEQSSEDVCNLYPKYYKDVSEITSLDVYGVHKLFSVDDPSGALQHASKKLLLSGVRTGGKSKWDDIREARDTLNRWLELNRED